MSQSHPSSLTTIATPQYVEGSRAPSNWLQYRDTDTFNVFFESRDGLHVYTYKYMYITFKYIYIHQNVQLYPSLGLYIYILIYILPLWYIYTHTNMCHVNICYYIHVHKYILHMCISIFTHACFQMPSFPPNPLLLLCSTWRTWQLYGQGAMAWRADPYKNRGLLRKRHRNSGYFLISANP